MIIKKIQLINPESEKYLYQESSLRAWSRHNASSIIENEIVSRRCFLIDLDERHFLKLIGNLKMFNSNECSLKSNLNQCPSQEKWKLSEEKRDDRKCSRKKIVTMSSSIKINICQWIKETKCSVFPTRRVTESSLIRHMLTLDCTVSMNVKSSDNLRSRKGLLSIRELSYYIAHTGGCLAVDARSQNRVFSLFLQVTCLHPSGADNGGCICCSCVRTWRIHSLLRSDDRHYSLTRELELRVNIVEVQLRRRLTSWSPTAVLQDTSVDGHEFRLQCGSSRLDSSRLVLCLSCFLYVLCLISFLLYCSVFSCIVLCPVVSCVVSYLLCPVNCSSRWYHMEYCVMYRLCFLLCLLIVEVHAITRMSPQVSNDSLHSSPVSMYQGPDRGACTECNVSTMLDKECQADDTPSVCDCFHILYLHNIFLVLLCWRCRSANSITTLLAPLPQ